MCWIGESNFKAGLWRKRMHQGTSRKINESFILAIYGKGHNEKNRWQELRVFRIKMMCLLLCRCWKTQRNAEAYNVCDVSIRLTHKVGKITQLWGCVITKHRILNLCFFFLAPPVSFRTAEASSLEVPTVNFWSSSLRCWLSYVTHCSFLKCLFNLCSAVEMFHNAPGIPWQ